MEQQLCLNSCCFLLKGVTGIGQKEQLFGDQAETCLVSGAVFRIHHRHFHSE